MKTSRPRFAYRVARTLVVCVALGLSIVAYVAQPIFGLDRHPPAIHADSARLEKHVAMLAGALVPRTAIHVENLDRAADYVRDQFAAAGLEVSFQPFQVDGATYKNVLAHVGPDTPDKRERIVVGAHYDAAGPGVGADDNASGVAGLLELARLLRTAPLQRRVDFVAFALEEPPFFRTHSMGSYVHAQQLRDTNVAVRAMICLEMIGYFSDAADSQRYPIPAMRLVYPPAGDFIAVIGCIGQAGIVRKVKRAMAESTEIPVFSMNAPRFVPGVDFSDHFNYWDAGFDAVMISDSAFYRNANYHKSSDTADTLDYRRMAQVVEGVYGAIVELTR